MNKTHAKRPPDEIDGPLCGTKIFNPEFSATPTCLRCRTILEVERSRLVLAGAHAGFGRLGQVADEVSKSLKGFERTYYTLPTRGLFATVDGPRINPRNRHNHAHIKPSNLHIFASGADRRVSQNRAGKTETPPISRHQQLEVVSRRLNTPPSRKSTRVSSSSLGE